MHAPALLSLACPFAVAALLHSLLARTAALLPRAALCTLLAAACMQLVLAVSARVREPLLPCTPSIQSTCCYAALAAPLTGMHARLHVSNGFKTEHPKVAQHTTVV
jgi:hypothetical protein